MIGRRRKGVGDVLGAIMVLLVIFAASMVLLLAVGHLYVAVQDYHNAQVLTSMENKENITVVYMQSVPPSGSPGIVVTNYGIAVNVTSLIQIGPGGVSYTPESIYLPSGSSVPILESSQAAGVTTSYGGVFYTNYTAISPGMVPVSIFGEGVSIQSPYGSGLWYVPSGTNTNIHSSGKATWYVNGTVASPSGVSSSSITVDGPTTVTAVEDFYVSVSASPTGAGTTSPASGWYPMGSQITFSESPNSGSGYQYIFSGWSGTFSSSSTSFTETVYSSITEVANYNEQFYVSISSPNGWGNPQGAGWYNAGATATVSVTSPYSTGSGSQVVFSSWSGTLGSNSNPFSFTVNSPISEAVNWVQQYYVTVSASPTGGASSLSPSSGWYDSGAQVTFSETPDTGSGYQYVFQSWTGTYSSTSTSFSETVTGPIAETANYQAQYLVTASSSNYNEYIWAYQGGSAIGPYAGSVWLNAGDQVFVTSQFAVYGQQYMSSGVITSTQLVNQYIDWGGQTYSGYPDWWFNNPQGNFVMAFYGSFTAPSTGTYTIPTTSDDGSAVWISTSQSINMYTTSPVVNNWYQQGATQRTGSISLTAGQTYYIIVAYEQGNGGYMINLQWETPGASSYTEMPVTGTAYVYDAPFVSSSTSTVYSPGASGNPSTETFYGATFWSTLSLNAPATVSPSWSPVEYYLMMQASPSSEGSVSPGSGWYDSGAPVTISETPASGYSFTGWLGAGPGSYSGSSSTTTITMNGAVTEMAGFTNPNVPIYITTLNIVNSQSVAAGSPFQQMFTFNPSNYTAYEASNLGNIRFYYTNGTELYSWLEFYSGQPSGGNADQATSATVWISLHGMPASGSVQVYMEFYSTTTNFDANYWGEAPQLSPSYGEYDNGPNVFPAGYFNFAGTTMPSGWNTAGVTNGGITVNNGLTVNPSDFPNYVFSMSNSLSGNYVVDAYEVGSSQNTYMGAQFSSYTTSTTSYPGSQKPSSGGMQWDAGGTNGENIGLETSGTAYGALTETIPGIYCTTWQVDSVGVYHATAYMWVNYGYQLSAGTKAGSNYPGLSAWGLPYTVQWFRIRATPPNGVMPTVTIS